MSAASSSDNGAGKPEPSDYGWMGAGHRLGREKMTFRGSRKPVEQPGDMYPAGRVGVQSCATDCEAAF